METKVTARCFFVIETDEKNPKRIAAVKSLPIVTAEGYRVRTCMDSHTFEDVFSLEQLLQDD